MKIFVIPDIHLKPWMFGRALELMEKERADRAVCLMDIADDWKQEFNLDLYSHTYDAAIFFSRMRPDTLWCYGNHDLCYVWDKRETGYSPIAHFLVCEKLEALRRTLQEEGQMAFVHRIENVLFSHGGLSEAFAKEHAGTDIYGDTDAVIKTVNALGKDDMWQDGSPIWYRPQYCKGRMYGEGSLLQVVGHTPVKCIQKEGSVISCDVFSTDSARVPIGTQEFLVFDTKTFEAYKVQ